MLGWYQEDYVDFVKTCEGTIDKIKKRKKDMKLVDGVEDWSDILLNLAQQQSIIAAYMAQEAGVDSLE